MNTIYLWEFAPSPHLGNILSGLVKQGVSACYVVHRESYESRRREGWGDPEFPGVKIVHAFRRRQISAVISQSDPTDVHICVGLRGNKFIRDVASELRRAGRRFFVFMETIDERKFLSRLKRPMYGWLFAKNLCWLEGVLAVGATTSRWVAERGVPSNRIFEFAYFLKNPDLRNVPLAEDQAEFRLIYVGNLVRRKRVDRIIGALGVLPSHVHLDVVGDGPLRDQLKRQAELNAPGRVTFHGSLPMQTIPAFLARADCLVLASDHDGWGSVIPEALLVGTRVVCSDRCGASVVVRASGGGRVFATLGNGACAEALHEEAMRGAAKDSERVELVVWARCLTEDSGALYLRAIIAHARQRAPRPSPPWRRPDGGMGTFL